MPFRDTIGDCVLCAVWALFYQLLFKYILYVFCAFGMLLMCALPCERGYRQRVRHSFEELNLRLIYR